MVQDFSAGVKGVNTGRWKDERRVVMPLRQAVDYHYGDESEESRV